MERLIRAAGQRPVDRDEVGRPRRLARDDDLVLAQAAVLGEVGGLDGRNHHALVDDVRRRLAQAAVGVLLHLCDDQLLVERAAVHADAHGLAMIPRDPADRGELLVAAPAGADVAGVDAVLVECLGTSGVTGEQQVAVVMEIANEGCVAPLIQHPLLDLGNRGGGLRGVDGDAHHLGSGRGELDALACRRRRVGGVRHRHRLHDDRGAAAHVDTPDAHADGLVNAERLHVQRESPSPDHSIGSAAGLLPSWAFH